MTTTRTGLYAELLRNAVGAEAALRTAAIALRDLRYARTAEKLQQTADDLRRTLVSMEVLPPPDGFPLPKEITR
jgi:hypothetical protein